VGLSNLGVLSILRLCMMVTIAIESFGPGELVVWFLCVLMAIDMMEGDHVLLKFLFDDRYYF